jgi:hypothetical protein
MHTLCVHGGGGKVLPLPQRCTSPAHEEATLPLSLLLLLWLLPLQSPLPSLLPSLLPCDSSTEFSNRLTELLLRYDDESWKKNLATYYHKICEYKMNYL